MASRPRTRLGQKMQAARLTQTELLGQFPDEARRLGIVDATISERALRRWLGGGSATPRMATCRVLEAMFGEPIERLFGPPEVAAHLERGTDAVAEAGRRSVEHAIAAASALDQSAIEHLQAGAQRAATMYLSAPPLGMLAELVQLRDTTYAQLDRTNKPRQQAELYLLAGLFCGLLASVSFDLGHADVADEQARAAHTYGSVIDHPSLCAWARGLQATVANWSAQPRRGVAITEAALAAAPPGTARVRLHSVRARSLAMIGARDEVAHELTAAAAALDGVGDPFLDGIGGELVFDRSRYALCASSAYLCLNDGEHAEPAAQHAIDAFALLPYGQRWESGAVAARVDLGTARLLRGDLAGCEAAILDVFELPTGERSEAVAQRLLGVARLVSAPRFQRSIEAQRLGDNIAEFTATSLGRTTARPAIAPP